MPVNDLQKTAPSLTSEQNEEVSLDFFAFLRT